MWIRRQAADGLIRCWEVASRYGTAGSTSRYAHRFHHVGEGTALGFPPGARLGEEWIHIGNDTLIGPNVALSVGLWAGDNLEPEDGYVLRIGDRCNIGRGGSIAARVGIDIGDDVTFAPNVFITDHNHDYGQPRIPIKLQWVIEEPVRIGAGCWLGVGVVVLPGTTIGTNVAVAAGSVVRGEIPDRCVIAGVPAKVIRRWDDDKQCWDPPPSRSLGIDDIPTGWYDDLPLRPGAGTGAPAPGGPKGGRRHTEPMARTIESVAVLGCGTMGSGIAAASAAAGCRVLMLDLSTEMVEKGLEAVGEEHRHLVTTGTFGDDLQKIADYDWVCEAIVEDVDVKRELFAKIEPLRRDGSVVSSNTSGIPLRDIAEGFGPRFQADVAITHFFNPVRVMKLFELVPGESTESEVIEAFADFGATKLNKGVVHAKDTVNFIGNRIGCFFMLSGLHLAKPFLMNGVTQETIDAVLAKPIGLPPTGLYGLIDLIGLDVMDLVGKNLAVNLPDDDVGRAYTAFPEIEQGMLDRGQLGRKASGGFSRMVKLDDGARKRETFDLNLEEWRDGVEPDLEGVPGDLGEILFVDSIHGELAWQVFGGTLRYAAGLVPEIADDIVNIDRAIRWGFNWALGPFEFLDAVGPSRVMARIEDEGGDITGMLAVLRDSGVDSFYRTGSDDERQYLTAEGNWAAVGPE